MDSTPPATNRSPSPATTPWLPTTPFLISHPRTADAGLGSRRVKPGFALDRPLVTHRAIRESDEFDANGLGERAERLRAAQQLLHGLPSLVAVVLGEGVH